MNKAYRRQTLKSAMIGLLVALACGGVNGAETVTWIKAGDGMWDDATAWSGSLSGTPYLPQAGDKMLVDATSPVTVTLTNATPNLYQTYLGSSSGRWGVLHVKNGGVYWATDVRALCVGYNGSGIVTQEVGSLVVTTTDGNPDSTGNAQDISLGQQSRGVGRYVMNGGRLACGRDLYIGNSGSGEFILNGGLVTWNRMFVFAAAKPSTIVVNGGQFGNNRRPFSVGNNNGAALLKIVGSAAVIDPTDYTHSTNGTLSLYLDNGGISPILSTGTLNTGALKVGFKGGAALLTNSTFTVIRDAISGTPGDFETKPDTAMWTTSKTSGYVITLASGSGSYEQEGLTAQYSDIVGKTFAAAGAGHLEISGINTEKTLEVFLVADSGTGKTEADLVAYFAAGGHTADAVSKDSYNIRLSFEPTAETSRFAWDLSEFNADAAVAGVGIGVIPAGTVLIVQ